MYHDFTFIVSRFTILFYVTISNSTCFLFFTVNIALLYIQFLKIEIRFNVILLEMVNSNFSSPSLRDHRAVVFFKALQVFKTVFMTNVGNKMDN